MRLHILIFAFKIIIVSTLFFLFSCTKLLLKGYGVKQPAPLSNEKIGVISEKLGLPKGQSFVLDKNYFKVLAKRDTGFQNNKYSEMISKYVQPLQLLYFDDNGKLISFHNNCYAQGFPKLKWNKEGQFNRFIPLTTIPISDTILNLEILVSNLHPLNNTYGFKKSKVIIILFWCNFLLKQSKELIKVATNNLRLNNDKNSFIVFVNTDNCYTDEKFANQINKIK